ncbi:protein translocase SEC61 complex subunit gamma [archaeon]|nr:protein translocase SEC61 complex subunit gamma [archaeon]|tara:strand:+ start:3028 stop:3228 length:201 start_codon:yes stop_codon:yes gene_type:complete
MEASDSNSNSFLAKAKRFWKQTVRVLRITKKPGKEEYLTVVKVTGLGMAVIGLVGFLIFMIKQVLF